LSAIAQPAQEFSEFIGISMHHACVYGALATAAPFGPCDGGKVKLGLLCAVPSGIGVSMLAEPLEGVGPIPSSAILPR
jgi:hypothetical protein